MATGVEPKPERQAQSRRRPRKGRQDHHQKIQQRSRWRRPDHLSYRAGSGRPCASVDRVTGSDGLNAIVDLNVSNGGRAVIENCPHPSAASRRLSLIPR